MKVYQLMTLLEKFPAGNNIKLALSGTLPSDAETCDLDGEDIIISGGDAEVIDDDGSPMGWLSSLTEVTTEE